MSLIVLESRKSVLSSHHVKGFLLQVDTGDFVFLLSGFPELRENLKSQEKSGKFKRQGKTQKIQGNFLENESTNGKFSENF